MPNKRSRSFGSTKSKMSSSAKMRLGRLFARGNFKGFLSTLGKADKRLRASPQALLVAGHAHYELGDFKDAINAYSKILRKGVPWDLRQRALYNRGLAYREIDEDERALKDFFSAGVRYEKSRSLIGELLYLSSRRRQDRLLEAKRHLTIWVREHPDDHYSRFWLGACYNQMDKPSTALKHMLYCLNAGYFTPNSVKGVAVELAALMEHSEIEKFLHAKARAAGIRLAKVKPMIKKVLADLR